MRVLLVGQESKLAVCRSWIEDEFNAVVRMCESTGKLKPSILKARWDLVIVDFDDQFDPGELIRIFEDNPQGTSIIAISENVGEGAVDAMRMGVSDYLAAPVDKEKLLISIRKIHLEENGKINQKEKQAKDEDGNEKAPLPENILFEGSNKMNAIKEVVEKILSTDLPILITGESGTGKEMVARYIHVHSNRKGPFIRVNCAAIPSELLESELFGYERGAFTGAYKRKPGKFEAADTGFLFLDEISELSYPLQSKLLHVLQDGTVTTLGSTREVPVNVRIIAATNQNLDDCVRTGTFRDDLFFRLNVVRINVPPLRDRLDHLGVLIDYFCEKFAVQYNVRPVKLSPEARSFLYTYPWPGNIRELENAIRRATVLGGENYLDHTSASNPPGFNETGDHPAREGDLSSIKPPSTIPDEQEKTEGNGEAPHFEMGMSLKEIAKEAALVAEREAIERVLQKTRWNRKKTAKILDVSYKTLLTKIKETGLDEN
jgi:two-component system response regulator AtoC